MATIAPLLTPGITFELSIPGVQIDGADVSAIGYFTEISGLSAEVETLTYNEGGMNEFVHRLPTRVKYPNLVLKRGITSEDGLMKWFQRSNTEAKRTDITITMLNHSGERVRTFTFVNAYPIKWTGPTFNSGQSQMATEAIEIAHDGVKPV
jgi:phage tail-like protein